MASQVYHWDAVLEDMFSQIEDGTLGGEAMAISLENGGLVIEFNGCYELDDDVRSGAVGVIEDIIAGDVATN